MLKRLKKPQHQKLAEKAARESAPENGVGAFLGSKEEDSHLSSYRFEAKLKGYAGWEWHVVLYQSKKSAPPTISEVVMLPGENALIAPSWIPWSERRAEIEKSLAEASAAADLEESENSKGDSEDTGERPPRRNRVRKRITKDNK
ncbi:MAG: DUF3027 domain-containing protein [Actinomycetota bacterium]